MEDAADLGNFRVSLGGDPFGHKHQEGDQRTPEGRYILDWRNPASRTSRSMCQGSGGREGTQCRSRRHDHDPRPSNGFGWWGWLLQLVDWTDGCIGVTDSDMDEIWAMVADWTPIDRAMTVNEDNHE
ncbi:L,D-transpeptidase family protein [Mesorhizobium sp. Cs1321R2N1]|uniref:L,D-transpeptidase family protein n=1 Tax=Mesorhizobium sp. Cs1321R2N1 TaxID=3015174 RepID=UPI00301D9439